MMKTVIFISVKFARHPLFFNFVFIIFDKYLSNQHQDNILCVDVMEKMDANPNTIFICC